MYINMPTALLKLLNTYLSVLGMTQLCDLEAAQVWCAITNGQKVDAIKLLREFTRSHITKAYVIPEGNCFAEWLCQNDMHLYEINKGLDLRTAKHIMDFLFANQHI